MNISLYGGSRETYRDMCGRDAFDQVVANIRALKEAGVDVSLNLSITPWNCQDLERISAIARELGTPVRASSYMYPPIRVDGQQCQGSRRLTAREAARYRVRWEQLTLEEPEFLLRAERMKALSAAEPRECAIDTDAGVSCRAGSTSFWLTWDGRMLPCGMMPFPRGVSPGDGLRRGLAGDPKPHPPDPAPQRLCILRKAGGLLGLRRHVCDGDGSLRRYPGVCLPDDRRDRGCGLGGI